MRIIDVFEENDTAYYVMEYAEGGSLEEKVRREGYLSEPCAARYILQVAEALKYIHQRKMNHLDVKPANIMLNEKDEAVLIDFGLSKQYQTATDAPTTTGIAGLSEGYAPLEQYDGSLKEFTPEIDVYSLGATFFFLLTGSTLPQASVVNNEGLAVDRLEARGVSSKSIAIISKAMEGRKKDRMKSVQAFVDSMNATGTSDFEPRRVHRPEHKNDVTQLIQKPTTEGAGSEKQKKNALSVILISVLSVSVVAVAVVFFLLHKPNKTSVSSDEATYISGSSEGESEERYDAIDPVGEGVDAVTDEEEVEVTEKPERRGIYRHIKKNVFVRSGPGTEYEPLYSPYNDFDSNHTNGVVTYAGSTVEVLSDVRNGFVKVRQSTPNNDRDEWGEGWVSAQCLE